MEKNSNWIERQIRLAQDEVKDWPRWMRDNSIEATLDSSDQAVKSDKSDESSN